MKITKLKKDKELKAYQVGNTILSGDSLTLIAGEDGRYIAIDLLDSSVTPLYMTLEDLYKDLHDVNDRLVNVEMLIKGEA